MNQQYKYSRRHDSGRGSQTPRVLSQTSLDWFQKKGALRERRVAKGQARACSPCGVAILDRKLVAESRIFMIQNFSPQHMNWTLHAVTWMNLQ